MVSISIEYQGDLHCSATHGPSGTVMSTDAPVDNQGKGESFSPTDLVATALGTCILTTMGIVAARAGINMNGSTASVEKAMTSSPPRRIAELTVYIHVPHDLSDDDQKRLVNAAHSCPVHKSMHPDVAMPISFTWGPASA
jgi:putative redox protein